MVSRTTFDISTPALIIDAELLEQNLTKMASHHPGAKLRPHVKAHKCTTIAKAQQRHGHNSFTCATVREVVGLAGAGLGIDLLLANEVVDPHRLRELVTASTEAQITIAVDSQETISAAAKAGLTSVLIDVNVGLPRCGVAPEQAGGLADVARKHGLIVRGVMGYEGHLMMAKKDNKQQRVAESMTLLVRAAKDVGGEIISAGGTGTWNLHGATGITELQAGSYALMDSQYQELESPFVQAAFVLGSVISVSKDWIVIDVGLKALGMDHGNPSVAGYDVLFCSDEHTTLVPNRDDPPNKAIVGDKLRVQPAHIDPTMTMHASALVMDKDDVVDQWPIDLRGW